MYFYRLQRYTFFINLCNFFVINVTFLLFWLYVDYSYKRFLYFCIRMTDKKSIVFILNPVSGSHGKEDVPGIIDETLDKDIFDCQIRLTEYAGHAAEIARECVAENIDVVVAVGGDGTVNEVARSLAHSDTALGIIPCGSGNGLARHLCIPMDIRKAIGIINRCKIEPLDYGIINDMPFFCTCGMGFDAFISLKFAEAGKRGPITYVENVLKEGLKYKPETYEVEDETGAKKYKAFLDRKSVV